MKFEKNPQYFNIALYAFIVIAASMVFFQILRNPSGLFGWVGWIAGILQPFVVGLVLAYLLNPMVRFFDDTVFTRLFKIKLRRKIRRIFSIFFAYILASVLVSLFIAIVIPQLIISFKSIFNQIPQFAQTIWTWYSGLRDTLAQLPIMDGDAAADAFSYGMIDKLMNTTQTLLESVYAQLEQMLPSMILATTKITSAVINAVVGLIISIYVLYDREKFFAQLKKVMTAILPKRVFAVGSEIVHETHKIFSGFIVGKIIDSIIIGILCFIGMSIFRMNYAMLISVIVGVTNVIPYFGPFIGAIPGILILYINNPMQAFWFLVFIFLLQQFDGNILGPKILGDSTGLNAFWVIFSITFFSGVFGIIGMFIGVPLFALIYYLVKRFVSFLLARKGEPIRTSDYDSDANPLLK